MEESGGKWFKVVDKSQPGGAIRDLNDWLHEKAGVCVMFMGEYNHTVDPKGRLIVPSKFREQLGNEFVVTKGLDGCLFVYSNEEWHRIEENLREKPLTSKDARKFLRFFFAGAANCEVDKQGRILLPANLREYAGIDKEVVSVGVYSRVEIWSKDRYLENTDFDDMDEIAEHMAELGIGI